MKFAILPFFLLAALSAHGQNLVVNPGFETGDLTGYTRTGGSGDLGVGNGATHSGTYEAYFGNLAASGTLAQTIPTTTGTTYLVEFYARAAGGTQANDNAFTAGFGNRSLTLGNLGLAYNLYAFTATATSPSTTLSFAAVNRLDYYLLDDIRVTATPEPGTWAALGLGAVALVRRRR